MSLLERNLAALEARDPRLARRLAEDEEMRAPGAPEEIDGVEITASACGLPTARYRGTWLHSRHDPRREAAAQIARETDPQTSTAIILGFGLGYAAEAFHAARDGAALLVVEPDPALFRAALSARDLHGLLESPRCRFHVGEAPEGIPARLETLPLERPAFLKLRPRAEKDPASFHAAEEIARSFLLRREINVNTLKRFGKLWVRNLCGNIGAFVDAPGILPLEGLFAGIPALVLAGGPTLDAVAPHLPELARRMLVVAVNTSLGPCLAAGVCPDFTVVVDPQYWASRSLDWSLPSRGYIVVEPSTHPRAVRAAGDRLLMCGSLFPLGELMDGAVGERGKLGAGGSVSTSAWDLARLAGCTPMYTAGLDLGYPGMRTHCRHAFFEEAWHAVGRRLSPAEGLSRASLREIGVFPVRSSGGGWVATDRRMLLYKWWFENALAMRPGLQSRTLSPDGVGIDGMPAVGMEEALAFPPARERIEQTMQEVGRILRGWKDSGARRQSLLAALGRLRGELRTLESAAEEGLSATARLGDAVATQADPRPHLAALDGVDRDILEVSSRNIAGFLIQSVIHRVQGAADGARDAQAVLATSSEIYSGIGESARFQRELLDRAIDGLAARIDP